MVKDLKSVNLNSQFGENLISLLQSDIYLCYNPHRTGVFRPVFSTYKSFSYQSLTLSLPSLLMLEKIRKKYTDFEEIFAVVWLVHETT